MDISQVVQSGQQATKAESPKGPTAESSARSAGAQNSDGVAISDEAVFLNQLDNGSIEWGRSFTTSPPIPRSLSEIREWVSDYSDGLRARVEDIFQQHNVNLEQDLDIQVDDEGLPQIDPAHPQAQEAQQALDGHPEVINQLGEQQQREQLASALEIGGALRSSTDNVTRQVNEQALSQQLSQPQAYQLTVPADTISSTNDQAPLA